MDDHVCNKEDLLLEMHGDVKTLVAEFKAMNGTLKETKNDIEKHKEESELHRYRITVLWFVAQGIKWAIGGGILTTLLFFIFKK